MKMKLIVIILALMAPTCCLSAGPVQYYSYPDAANLPDAGRILMYDGAASKNITGAKLKSEIIRSISTPSDTPIVKQSATATNPQVRQLEIKDATGNTTLYVTADGTLVFGP